MISQKTFSILSQAISNQCDYTKGVERKLLQATYDKMLNEISLHLFNEPCSNKMVLRQKINRIENKNSKIRALIELIKNSQLLFSRDYRDYSSDIDFFLENHMTHFLRELSDEY